MIVYRIGEHAYTPRQAAVLCALIKGPMAVDGLTGWDRNALSALADRDVVDLNDVQARITDAGRKVVVELNKKVNGDSKQGPQPEEGTRRSSAPETSGTGAQVSPQTRAATKEKPTTRRPRQTKGKTSTQKRRLRRDSRERPAPKSPPPHWGSGLRRPSGPDRRALRSRPRRVRSHAGNRGHGRGVSR